MVFVPDIKVQRTAGVFTIQRQIIAHAVVKILLAVGNANEEGRNRDPAKGRLLLIVSRSGRIDRIGRGAHIIYVNRCYRGAWDGGILVGIQMARALCFNRHLAVIGCGSGISAVLRRKARNADDELSFPGVCGCFCRFDTLSPVSPETLHARRDTCVFYKTIPRLLS